LVNFEPNTNIGSFVSKLLLFSLRQDFNSYVEIMSGTWRLLEADPGGQPGTDREVKFRYAFMYVQK
jgi:hypothetical protein